MGAPERLLARLTVEARAERLAAVAALVRAVGTGEGLAPAVIGHLEALVDEAVSNVVEHAFDPGETGTVDVVLLRRPGQLVAAVEDRGLPFDASAGTGGLGVKIMRAFADELRFVNLGRSGKRVEMVLELEGRPEEEPLPLPGEVPESAEEVELRLMRPEDAPGLARCVYRSYGYTYAGESLYRPEQVAERIRAGLQLSCVAATTSGEIGGHLALLKESAASPVGETGQAVVMPAFRGRKLFEKMKAFVVERAREGGLRGVFSEAVTIHPFTQKGNLALGAAETGLLLGYIPSSMAFRGIPEGNAAERQAAMLYYLAVGPHPEREVYVPLHHGGIVREVYSRAGLPRRFATASGALPGGATRIEVVFRPGWGQAILRVLEWGADAVEAVSRRLKALRLQRVDCILLDLPLAEPATALLCAPLEGAGFGFAGVLPELHDGDVLRLQHLNNVEVAPERIHAVSDAGRQMKEYVLASAGIPAGPVP